MRMRSTGNSCYMSIWFAVLKLLDKYYDDDDDGKKVTLYFEIDNLLQIELNIIVAVAVAAVVVLPFTVNQVTWTHNLSK